MKRTSLIVLALAAALAARGSVHFSCSITDERRKTVEITGFYSEDQELIVIPKTLLVDGRTYNVTSIAGQSLKRSEKVRDVYIPETVLSLAPDVFGNWQECPNLETARWKDKICNFRPYDGEKADNMIRPYIIDEAEGTCGIGYSPEYKLKELTIPEELYFAGRTWKVIEIAPGAFRFNEYLQSVYIPQTVTSFGESAFYNCPNLRYLYADGEWHDVSSTGNLTLNNAINFCAELADEAVTAFTGEGTETAAKAGTSGNGRKLIWILVIVALLCGEKKSRNPYRKGKRKNIYKETYRGRFDGQIYNSMAERDYYDKIHL